MLMPMVRDYVQQQLEWMIDLQQMMVASDQEAQLQAGPHSWDQMSWWHELR